MGRKSRVKGATFERKIADKLSMVMYGKKGILRRTPMSGGWSGLYAWGDVCGPKDFQYYIECRNRECWKLKDLINKTSVLASWWEEVTTKASNLEKIPILLIKKNHENVYVISALPLEGLVLRFEKPALLVTLKTLLTYLQQEGGERNNEV